MNLREMQFKPQHLKSEKISQDTSSPKRFRKEICSSGAPTCEEEAPQDTTVGLIL